MRCSNAFCLTVVNKRCKQVLVSRVSKVVGIRLSVSEVDTLTRASRIEDGLGQRGGLSGWLRRLALREADRLLREEQAARQAQAGAQKRGEDA